MWGETMGSSLNDIYQEIDNDMDLEVIKFPMKSKRAMVRKDGLICVDYSKIETVSDEKEVLMEEIAHFETYSFYPLGAANSVWEKQEYRARKQIFEKRFPPEDIAILMAHGYVKTHEIAEQLEMPEPFVCEMLYYYKEIQNIDFSILIEKIGVIPPKKEVFEEEQENIKTEKLKRKMNPWEVELAAMNDWYQPTYEDMDVLEMLEATLSNLEHLHIEVDELVAERKSKVM